MTPADLRAALARLHLSQAGLARELGMSTRAVEEWAAGRTPVPPWLSLALETLERRRATPAR